MIVTYWPAIFGIGVPFLAGAIAKCNWSSSAKTWAAFGVSVLVGILGTLVAGLTLTPVTLTAFIVSVFTIAQLAYPEFKKHELTAKWLDALLTWRSPK
jgi:hypothetical protein